MQLCAKSERAILIFRYQMIKYLNRCKYRFKSFLYFTGIKYPDQFQRANSHWSGKFMFWIKSIPKRDLLGEIVLDSLLTEVKNLKTQLLETNLNIKHLSKTLKYQQSADLLLGISGLDITTVIISFINYCKHMVPNKA